MRQKRFLVVYHKNDGMQGLGAQWALVNTPEEAAESVGVEGKVYVTEEKDVKTLNVRKRFMVE